MLERIGKLSLRAQQGLLLVVCAFLFLPWLVQTPLTEADEAIYAEVTREMLAAHQFIIPHFNGAPFYEKPILTYWLQLISAHVFGMNGFAIRVPSVLLAVTLVLVVHAFLSHWLPRAVLGGRPPTRRGIRDDGNEVGDGALRAKGAAFCAGVALAAMPMVAAWARAGTMDIPVTVFSTFMLLALLAADLVGQGVDDRAESARRARRWYLAAAAAGGLAFLTKGPVGIAVPGMVWLVYHLLRRDLMSEARRVPWVSCLFITENIAVPWYVATFVVNGSAFLQRFFLTENLGRFAGMSREGHGAASLFVRLCYYVPWSLLLLFPCSIFLLRELIAPCIGKGPDGRSPLVERMRVFAWVWVLSDIAVFSLSHTQLPSYIQAVSGGAAILFALHLFYRSGKRYQEPFHNQSQKPPCTVPTVLETAHHEKVPGTFFPLSPLPFIGRWVEVALLTLVSLVCAALPLILFFDTPLQSQMAGMGIGRLAPTPPAVANTLVVASIMAAVALLAVVWTLRIRGRDEALPLWATALWLPQQLILFVALIVGLQSIFGPVEALGSVLRAQPPTTRIMCLVTWHSESLVFYARHRIEYYISPDGNPPGESWFQSAQRSQTFPHALADALQQRQQVVLVTDENGMQVVRALHHVSLLEHVGDIYVATVQE